MRRIQTGGGVLIGKVDRALRKVIWSLECGECAKAIPLDADTFQGKRPPRCECGWTPEPEGQDDGRPFWFDFAADFETVPGQPQPSRSAA